MQEQNRGERVGQRGRRWLASVELVAQSHDLRDGVMLAKFAAGKVVHTAITHRCDRGACERCRAPATRGSEGKHRGRNHCGCEILREIFEETDIEFGEAIVRLSGGKIESVYFMYLVKSTEPCSIERHMAC